MKKEFIERFLESGFNSEEAEKEAQKLSALDYTFEEIGKDYRTLCEIETFAGAETETSPGGHNPQWTVRTELGIAIIREERYKVRRAIAHKREEERKAEQKLREIRRGRR